MLSLLFALTLTSPEWGCVRGVETYTGRRDAACRDPHRPIQCLAQKSQRCGLKDRVIERNYEQATSICRSSHAECWALNLQKKERSNIQLRAVASPWRFQKLRSLGWQCEAERHGQYFLESAPLCESAQKRFACFEEVFERCSEGYEAKTAFLYYERFTGVCSTHPKDCL